MFKNLILTFSVLFLILFCASCSQKEFADSRSKDEPRIIQYLEDQRLPALQDARVWKNSYGPGVVLETEHYLIYTTWLESLVLNQVPGFMESAFSAYRKQVGKDLENDNKFKVYLFKERDDWEKFTKNFAREKSNVLLKIKAGGYYENGACVTYDIGRERTFSLLGHEGWHQFNSHLSAFQLPSWLDEGVAMQFEKSEFVNGNVRFIPSRNFYRLVPLKMAYAKDRLLSLKQIIVMNPGQVIAMEDNEAIGAYYSQAYGLVRFLKEYKGGRYFSKYQKLLADGFEGNWNLNGRDRTMAADRNIPLNQSWNSRVGIGLFLNYISEDFEEIERQYFTFCRNQVNKVRISK